MAFTFGQGPIQMVQDTKRTMLRYLRLTPELEGKVAHYGDHECMKLVAWRTTKTDRTLGGRRRKPSSNVFETAFGMVLLRPIVGKAILRSHLSGRSPINHALTLRFEDRHGHFQTMTLGVLLLEAAHPDFAEFHADDIQLEIK